MYRHDKHNFIDSYRQRVKKQRHREGDDIIRSDAATED